MSAVISATEKLRSSLSRSLEVTVNEAASRLSSPDVSVKLLLPEIDRTGVSLAPVILAVNVWLAEAVPSLAVRVKLSV